LLELVWAQPEVLRVWVSVWSRGYICRMSNGGQLLDEICCYSHETLSLAARKEEERKKIDLLSFVGYNTIAVIPAGATAITVVELSPSRDYFGQSRRCN